MVSYIQDLLTGWDFEVEFPFNEQLSPPPKLEKKRKEGSMNFSLIINVGCVCACV